MRGFLRNFLIAASFLVASAALAQPFSPTPWTFESNVSSTRAGTAVASAGDVNGDGYDDIIVGSARPGVNGARAYVFLGSAAGLAPAPGWTAAGPFPNSTFGTVVSGAGDVNGDGYGDVIVGDPGHSTAIGRAYVYLGSPSGLAAAPAWFAEGTATASLGASVACAGDVNGDGYDDVLVGAPHVDNGHTDEGAVYVYHGSAAGLPAAPSWTKEGDQPLFPNGTGANFGAWVSPAGDVNGDGFDDVIIAAPGYDNGHLDEGAALVYLGSPSGLASTHVWMAESNAVNRRLARRVAAAGDVDGDGYDDVFVTQHLPNVSAGTVYLHRGTASGVSAAPTWTRTGDASDDDFGRSLAPAGDINGDGIGDFVIGAPEAGQFIPDEGKAYLYFGKSGGGWTTPSWSLSGQQSGALLGSGVASADVNGDGFDDLILGSEGYDGPSPEEGRVIVYLAQCLPPTPEAVYGWLLFPAVCARSAAGLTQDTYVTKSVEVVRGTHDRFFLSGDDESFAPLIADDEVHVGGVDSGLGPYALKPGVPPYKLGVAITEDFVEEPPQQVTTLVPLGHSTVTFEIRDTQRAIYGSTAVYLIRDCGLRVTRAGVTTSLHWMTHDDQVAGVPPTFEVRWGRLSELKADGGFARSSCLGDFAGTPVTDLSPSPSFGDGNYFLTRGSSSCVAQGFGDSTLVPDPRDTLDALPVCP